MADTETETTVPEAAETPAPEAVNTTTPDVPATDSQGDTADAQVPAATEAVPEAETEETTASFDVDSIFRAAQLGLSKEAIAKHANDESLKATLDALEEQQKGQQQREQQTQRPASRERAAPKPLAPFKLELDPELISEELAGPLQAMVAHNHEQMVALSENMQAQMERVFDFIRQEDFRRVRTDFNAAMEKLPEEYSALKTDQKFHKEVVNIMNIMTGQLREDGKELPPFEAMFQKAARIAAGEKPAASARKTLVATLKSKKSQMLARPTQRAAKTLKTEDERAEAAAAAFLAKQGGGADTY